MNQDIYLDNIVAEQRDAMISARKTLNSRIDDFDQEFTEWAAYSTKEMAKPQQIGSQLMLAFSHNQAKAIEALITINESFGKVVSTNNNEFLTSSEIDLMERLKTPIATRATTPAVDENKSTDESSTPLLSTNLTGTSSSSTPSRIQCDPTAEEILSMDSFADSLGVEYKNNLGSATKHLSQIFSQGMKEYSSVVNSLITNDDIGTGSDGDFKNMKGEDVGAALIPMLQFKNNNLRKELEDAHMKSRSVTVQW